MKPSDDDEEVGLIEHEIFENLNLLPTQCEPYFDHTLHGYFYYHMKMENEIPIWSHYIYHLI
jgi:hypothetical protein